MSVVDIPTVPYQLFGRKTCHAACQMAAILLAGHVTKLSPFEEDEFIRRAVRISIKIINEVDAFAAEPARDSAPTSD